MGVEQRRSFLKGVVLNKQTCWLVKNIFEINSTLYIIFYLSYRVMLVTKNLLFSYMWIRLMKVKNTLCITKIVSKVGSFCTSKNCGGIQIFFYDKIGKFFYRKPFNFAKDFPALIIQKVIAFANKQRNWTFFFPNFMSSVWSIFVE